ncbi:MAG: alpha-L-rhamnosidase-related protein [Planctomycetota bacterium]|jgi:hypothetical protein
MKSLTRAGIILFVIAVLTGNCPADSKEGCAPMISDSDVCIPEAVVLPAEVSYKPNKAGQLSYVPSQIFAPFPDRLFNTIANMTTGIDRLDADKQKPIEDGIEFTHSSSPAFELSHRRSGIWCGRVPWVKFRMNRHCLSDLHFGIQEGDDLWPLDEFDHNKCILKQGRIIYQLQNSDAELAVNMTILIPVAPTAYGCLCQIQIENLANKKRSLEVIAIKKKLPKWNSTFSGPMVKKWGKELTNTTTQAGRLVFRVPESTKSDYAYDPNYSILVGFDSPSESGYSETTETGICKTKLKLSENGSKTCYLAAIIDSPRHNDKAKEKKRVSDVFARNQNLPENIRNEMTRQYIENFDEIIVDGDITFRKILAKASKCFTNSIKLWEKGVYRKEAVRFEMSDKKLQSFANFIANDLFSGLIQPPGIVHNAQHNDGWGYIFAYRHIHAASDLGFEPYVIGYLRMLSTNQDKKSGRIRSLNPWLKSGHGTQLDASYIDSLWHYYKWTGDLESIRQLWPTIKRAAEYINKNLDSDGDGLCRDIIHQWKSDFDSRGPSSAFQTAIVWKAMEDMAEFAQLMGQEESAKHYRAKANKTYKAVQSELWSDEFAMLGPKCPLGILRLHPQSLDIEMPIWTGLVDEFQGQALLDWSSTNLEFQDEDGGRWLYDNDFWPAVWSQHVPAQSDAMMVGWAHMLGGRNDIGNNIIRTIAAGSFRSVCPGVNYLFSPSGTTGSSDPATAQGAFIRGLVEGTFGVKPAIGKKQITVSPHFASDWNHARFKRAGLDIKWEKCGNKQTLNVTTDKDIQAVVELQVKSPVEKVTLNGKPISIKSNSEMYWSVVEVRTPKGGGEVTVLTTGKRTGFELPEEAKAGKPLKINITGVEKFKLADRFKMVDLVSASDDTITVKPLRRGTGRCIFFLECENGNIKWTQPIAIQIGPRSALEAVQKTVDEPIAETARFVPVDLSDSYTDDIQTWMYRSWQWDFDNRIAGEPWKWQGNIPPEKKQRKHMMGYWSMPKWATIKDLPRKIKVGQVPFLIGPMGPGEKSKENDLILLGNTPPHSSATSAKIKVGRKLHKFYLLSLNMNLPQKCYETAAEVIVGYKDGRQEKTVLAAPLNFDCFYQDYGINTKALKLPISAELAEKWPKYFGYNTGELHLTMTDVICDSSRTVEFIEIKSVATETFFGLAGLTLIE